MDLFETNDALGYDADVTDASQYCKHGTFIGSWWGPDYLCVWCETGEDPPPYIPPKYKFTFRTAGGPRWIDLGGYDRQLDEGHDRAAIWGSDTLAGIVRQHIYADMIPGTTFLLWEYRESTKSWVMIDRF